MELAALEHLKSLYIYNGSHVSDRCLLGGLLVLKRQHFLIK